MLSKVVPAQVTSSLSTAMPVPCCSRSLELPGGRGLSGHTHLGLGIIPKAFHLCSSAWFGGRLLLEPALPFRFLP